MHFKCAKSQSKLEHFSTGQKSGGSTMEDFKMATKAYSVGALQPRSPEVLNDSQAHMKMFTDFLDLSPMFRM